MIELFSLLAWGKHYHTKGMPISIIVHEKNMSREYLEKTKGLSRRIQEKRKFLVRDSLEKYYRFVFSFLALFFPIPCTWLSSAKRKSLSLQEDSICLISTREEEGLAILRGYLVVSMDKGRGCLARRLFFSWRREGQEVFFLRAR